MNSFNIHNWQRKFFYEQESHLEKTTNIERIGDQLEEMWKEYKKKPLLSEEAREEAKKTVLDYLRKRLK